VKTPNLKKPDFVTGDLVIPERHQEAASAKRTDGPVEARRCLLSEMGRGESGVVSSLLHQFPVSQKLMALGLIPGCRLRFLRNALLGDPMMVETTCGVICLRRREASVVMVDRVS